MSSAKFTLAMEKDIKEGNTGGSTLEKKATYLFLL